MKPEQNNNSRLDEPQVHKAKTSMLAVLAFILSIVGIPTVFIPTGVPCLFVPLLAIPSIIIGIVSLIVIKRSKGELEGIFIAGTGIVLSSIWVTFFFVCIPMLGKVKRSAYEVKQKAQLKSIDTAIELFNSEFDGYPPSDELDGDGKPYCGAIKLCEASMGRDLQGFHPDSKFRREGKDDSGIPLYGSQTVDVRKGPYLPLETANAFPLKYIYENVGPFDGNDFVHCDVFRKVTNRTTGKKAGMPILYYKADISKTAHNIDDPDDPNNIYDYKDNHALLALGVPGKPEQKHPLYENPKIFYEMTKDYMNKNQSKPNNAETFILISAGVDGLYGTKDDVANFEMGWKPK